MITIKYFKRLFAALIAAVTMVASMQLSCAAATDTRTVSGKFNYDYANQVLSILNSERAAGGLKAVTMDAYLTEAAMLRAAECKVSFSHTRPNGTSCFTAFEWSGRVGENIAYGQRSAAQVMQGWMNSQGHRENIMNSAFTRVGIGCFVDESGTVYWAQEFSAGSVKQSYKGSGSKNVTVNVSLTSAKETTVSGGTETPAATQPPATKPSVTQPATSKPTQPATEKTTQPTNPPVEKDRQTGAQKKSGCTGKIKITCKNGKCIVTKSCETGNCSTKNCSIKGCTTKSCTTKNCITKNCTTKRCTTKNCITKNCATKSCTTKGCTTMNCLTKGSTTKNCATKNGTTKNCLTKGCLTKNCSTKSCK